MKKFTFTVYGLYILFIISLSVFLFSVLLYTPLKQNSLRNIDLRYKDYVRLKKELQRKEELLQNWKSVESDYIKGKKRYFMRFEDFSKFRDDLKIAFRKMGLNENGFSVNYKKLLKGEYIRASIKFQVSGDYNNLKRLIYDLQGKEKIIIIRNLRLFRKSDTVIFGNFQLEVFLVP